MATVMAAALHRVCVAVCGSGVWGLGSCCRESLEELDWSKLLQHLAMWPRARTLLPLNHRG